MLTFPSQFLRRKAESRLESPTNATCPAPDPAGFTETEVVSTGRVRTVGRRPRGGVNATVRSRPPYTIDRVHDANVVIGPLFL